MKSLKKISLHTKVVFLITSILLVLGTLFFLFAEFNNPNTIGNLPFGHKVVASFFQSTSPRSSGFTTITIDQMTIASKFMTIILMFIGGSPGSTAGGVKTVTIGVLFITVVSTILGKEDVIIFKKKLQQSLINKALAITLISLSFLTFVTMALSITENTSFINILFEAASAFGTVGLTLGLTTSLSFVGKIIIIITMFFGRVGPLSVALALSRRASMHKSYIQYPEDRVMVG